MAVDRRMLIVLAALQYLACGAPAATADDALDASSERAPRPNILFILMDDLRWDALGAYGNESVRTPRLDALAAEGARLDALYVASPICSPSRASFLTGRYPHQRGISYRSGRWVIDPGIQTIATLAAAGGYATGFVGKAHLGEDPTRWGFAEVPLVLPGRRIGQRAHERRTRAAEEKTSPGGRGARREGEGGKDEEGQAGGEGTQKLITPAGVEWVRGHASARLIDAGIGFIERHRDERWLLWLAMSAPHRPYLYDPAFAHSPSELTPPPGWTPGDRLPRREWAGYYSLVAELDHDLGRLFGALESLGLSQSTIVIATSDNGVQLGSHGMHTKGVWYEASIRIPGIVRWPGRVPAGSTTSTPVSAVDLLPTIAELVGTTTPNGLEGRSFLAAVTGGSSTRSLIFSETIRQFETGGLENKGSWRMVREGNLKFVERTGSELLYDLQRDPAETRNVLDTPEQRRTADTLRKRLAEWQLATP